MKKLFFFFNSLFAIALSANAQKPESTQAIAHYKFSHMRDTTKPDDIYNENMVLFLGKNASVYKSYDRKLQEAMMKKQVAEQMAANAGMGGPIRINVKGGRGSSTEYFMFGAEKKFIRKEKLVNNYLVEEPMPVINWKISSDTASFAGLKCQKATGHFAGRDYTAWFCPDLPFHSGPWKLNGLPGLIIEAYDAKKQVVFKFDGLDDATKLTKPVPATGDPGTIQSGGTVVKLIGVADDNDDPTVIALPANGIKASEKEFTSLKEAMKKDPSAFFQSAMAASGSTIKMAPNTKTNFQVAPGPVINNPLELPEKK